MIRYLIPLTLLVVGCAAPVEEHNDPCPAPATLVGSGSSQNDPGDPASLAPKDTWHVYPGSLSMSAEQGMLRATRMWEEATVGAVHFRIHLATDKFECKDGNIFVVSLSPADALEQGMGEEVGEHTTAVGTLPGGCHFVRIVDPWPESMSDAWDALFARTGVSPLVTVAAHEFGHVLGVPHVAPEDRSVMVPGIKLVKVPGPTCMDVSLLSVTMGRPLTCRESN